MLSSTDVQALIDLHCQCLPAEPVPLSEALYRVLRQDVVAKQDMPSFTRSAMDGYLVLAEELPGQFELAGEVRPGGPAQMPAPGTCLRVFTGSAVPDQGVIVVMQEDVVLQGHALLMLHNPGVAHVRQRGSHHRAGSVLARTGQKLTPGLIAVLAAEGVANPLVSRLPRVAHIATGSELVDCASDPEFGQIRDSNSPLLASLVRAHGAAMVLHQRVDENPERLGRAIDEVLEAKVDMLMVSGGASVGDHDHTRACLQSAGFTLLVHGVNSRPGKPLIVGKHDSTIAFGLPGNPLSHFVCFHLFVRRALERMIRQNATELVPMPVQESGFLTANPRESWWPCQIVWQHGMPMARVLPWRDSSDTDALALADALLRVPPSGLSADTTTSVLPVNLHLS